MRIGLLVFCMLARFWVCLGRPSWSDSNWKLLLEFELEVFMLLALLEVLLVEDA